MELTMSDDTNGNNADNAQPWMDPNWEPTAAEKAALLDAEMDLDDGDTAVTARRLFKENAPTAALSIIRMATHGSTERIKLDASKYILERVLGKVGDDGEEIISPIDAVLNGLTRDAENHANS
jgi:hypothetical protein